MNKNDFPDIPELPKHPKFIQFFSTVVLIALGFGVLVCALFIPPKGEIHPSVLAAFGMTLCFAGTYLGMDYNSRSKFYEVLKLLSNYHYKIPEPQKRARNKDKKTEES